MGGFVRLLVAGLAAAGCCAWSAAARAAEDSVLLGPPPGDGPVIVQAGFGLRDLNAIDDEAESFEFEGVRTLEWRDERQAFDPAGAGVQEKVYQGAYQFNEVFTGWFPQVILVNQSGLYETQGVLLRIRPDGSMILTETMNARAKTDLDMRRYPFDRQRLEAVFEVLGFDESEVALRAASGASPAEAAGVRLSQWQLVAVGASIRRERLIAGAAGAASRFVVSVDVDRRSLFILRLVVLPLALIVMLSWSVFWMDRSSLGDRINVSFIGILSVVAYQIVVSEILPRISYLTLMNAFLNVSFFVVCASVVINLVVGRLDQRGEVAAGNRVDTRCRWIFPLVYFGLIALSFPIAFFAF